MAFNINHPLLLLLIPLAAAFVIFTSRNMIKLAAWRRRLILLLRICIFTLLIAAAAGIGLKLVSGTTTSIFVADGSDSTGKLKGTMEKWLEDAIKHKKSTDKVGVVYFGSDAAVERMPAEKSRFTQFQSKINPNFTDIEQGLKLASSLIPSGDKKRIVLMSDGRENIGDSLKAARILKQQNITLDVFPLKSAAGNEVQLKEIVVPEALRLKERFEIVLKINSTVNTKARIKLFSDKHLTVEKDVNIEAGENNFAFTDIADKGGMRTYSAVIEPAEDGISQNNSMSAFSYVDDVPQVLVIQDEDKGAEELVKIFGNDIKLKVSKPDSLPVTIDELQKYHAFVISNVSADRLKESFLNNLETCIKHQGKGLLVTGGDNSYAPGGYHKTVLEKVLPLEMDIKPKEEMPNLGLVLVIDKSGSMSEGPYGIAKVELAKEAALRSTEVLNKNDMVGVIGFDDAVQWVVKTQKLTDLKKIQDDIGTIRADGGTQILPPLKEAYLSLKKANTKLKHIILLTDGQAERTGYEPIIEDLNKAGITLSTVAVGSMADTQLLKALAYGGRGRYYATDEFTDIPKIFAKETFLAGKTYLNNRTFTPTLKGNSEILGGIDAVPTLDGYVGTTQKSTAKVIFASDRDDPVLATWQYGLGRTAAWTSDAKGMWTANWLKWGQSQRFWKNLVSWLLQKRTNEDYTLKGSIANGTGELELKMPPENTLKNEKVEAVVVKPDGKEQEMSLNPVSPGLYKGTFEGADTGVYIANIRIKDGEETIKNINSGVVVPYSPEYDIVKKDTMEFLERLAREGGGRMIRDSSAVFSGALPSVESITDLTSYLLILAIILLLLDIAIRRLNIPLHKVEAALQKVTSQGAKYATLVLKPAVSKIQAIKAAKKRKTMSSSDTITMKKESKVRTTSEQPVKSPDEPKGKETKKAEDSHISILLQKKKKRER